MSTWEDGIAKFQLKIDTRSKAIFANTAFKIRDSVKFGSPITGAPGQPVDTGNLRSSWQLTHPEPFLARLTTNVNYAPHIESGIGKGGQMVLHSKEGGFHSVKMTIAGFDRIVKRAVAEEVRE